MAAGFVPTRPVHSPLSLPMWRLAGMWGRWQASASRHGGARWDGLSAGDHTATAITACEEQLDARSQSMRAHARKVPGTQAAQRLGT